MARSRGVAIVLLVLAASIGIVAVTGQTTQFVIRALLWVAVGVFAVVAGARHRPEPPAAWQVLGVGCVLIGGSWMARALYPAHADLGGWPDLLSGTGLLMGGVGLLLAGRSRRQRVALLDGAILAGAVITFTWAAIVAPEIQPGVATDAQIGSAALHAFGGTLVVSVGVAIALATTSGMRWSVVVSGLGVVAALVAGVGWAYQGLRGEDQAVVGAVAWLVAAVTIGLVAASDEPVVDEGEAQTEMTTSRYMLLVLLAVMPALTIGIVNAVPATQTQVSSIEADSVLLLGIWVTISSVLFLAARIWASAGFAVEDERAAERLRFQRLIEYSTDVVCLLSARNEVFYASPSTATILGIPPDELLGERFHDLILTEDREEFSALVNVAVRSRGNPVPVRLRVVTADGNVRPAEGTITDLGDVPGVDGVVVTLRDISMRVALEDELTRAALEDPLTGLANRTLITDRLHHALELRTDDPPRIGLLFIDLDDFKTINDGLGHTAGDQVLRTVADRILSVVREGDTPARLGGDEFAILLEGLSPLDPEQAAHNVAVRLLEVMEEPIEVAGETVRVRLSIGLAMARVDMDEDELIQNADMAMYTAKQAGLKFASWDSGMESRARRRLLLTQDLEAALDADELEIRYQPIISMETGELVGVEALMRWTHPRFGRVPANEVEELAVRGGLANKMTAWAFDTVRSDKARWRARTGQQLKVGVNLAARQLTADVVRLFDRSFRDLGPRPAVQIELTESALLRDATAAARILGELRDRGATVAIDDFGTGYASLSYLRRLPVDVVKIDREFIAELRPASVRGSFAELIRDLARSLRLETVAEGIETEEQAEAVRLLGCEYGQGFLYGRATTMDALIAEFSPTTRRGVAT